MRGSAPSGVSASSAACDARASDRCGHPRIRGPQAGSRLRCTTRQIVHLLAGLAALAVSLPARAAPAEDPKRYFDIKKWYVEYTIHVHGDGRTTETDDQGDTDVTVWRINRTYSGRYVVDLAGPNQYGRYKREDVPVARGRFMGWRAKPVKRDVRNLAASMQPMQVTIDDFLEKVGAMMIEGGATEESTGRHTWQGTGTVKSIWDSAVYVDTVKKVFCLALPYRIRPGSISPTFVREESFSKEGDSEPGIDGRDVSPSSMADADLEDPSLVPAGVLLIPDMPLPPKGSNLSGSVSLPGRTSKAVGYGPFGVPVKIDVTWLCSPTPGPDLELVVSLKGDGGETYENWVPVGGAGTAGGRFFESTPGNSIVITAELRGIGTGEAIAKADQIRFELSGVSREPGVCMNAPKFPTATPYPDLGFDPQRNSGRVRVRGLDWQRADEAAGADPISTSTATVTSFDYGGWGDLKVTAYLKDGRTIVGHLEGFKDLTVIPLPKRQGGSLIADRWLRDREVVGKADNADDEEVPSGDNSNGDGLTLYEEYRGFADGGYWTAGNPTRKDYFIRDTVGARSKDGIDLFEGITQLNVHHRLYEWEISADRVINFNHSAGPHVVDQHGILLDRELFASGARAVGGPGTPKVIQRVYVGTGFRPSDPFFEFTVSGRVLQRDLWAATIAHELCHACSIWHHGEDDERDVVWSTVVDAEGGNVLLFEGATQIVCVREDGTLVPNVEREKPWTVYVGVPQGQHSGVEDCVMRYDCARCYRSRKAGAGNVRYIVIGTEVVGDLLCEDTKGTGCNDPLHKPHSRYGDAHQGRGACRYQICVNDALTPPSRDYGSPDE